MVLKGSPAFEKFLRFALFWSVSTVEADPLCCWWCTAFAISPLHRNKMGGARALVLVISHRRPE